MYRTPAEAPVSEVQPPIAHKPPPVAEPEKRPRKSSRVLIPSVSPETVSTASMI